jgi:threonine/homoserine/homoserine lactone efflux protein
VLAVLAEAVPLAVGIAASPFPVVPVILLLLGAHPRRAAGAFLGAWIVGVGVALVVPMLLAEAIDTSDDRPTWVTVLKIVFGLLLVAFGARKWLGRGKDAEPPAWTSSIATMTPLRAARLALLLSLANPKVWLLAGAAGLGIGASDLATGQVTAVVLVFLLVATSTVAVPVVLFLVLGERIEAPMRAAQGWLERNNDAVVAVVLAVIGAVLAFEGVAAL